MNWKKNHLKPGEAQILATSFSRLPHLYNTTLYFGFYMI